eukprot:CAMPEP_0181188308 /NCGR_PEP_ID=MMETSP1096-20121128/11040_1 /TAXON_ID=156174 ORGANISM="Chrysochromulina ericina, Strain CCMP281" /NCGR_SAMPLE_ID=MMETSP1096 /ASSEMBLY_ACC=CAM_ASM_000453 /LENGTH=166 /DNA_ID=CAMNT_0023277347 /DNA_START=119 /DNA_END=617 /DNA_ORIENTATION=+
MIKLTHSVTESSLAHALDSQSSADGTALGRVGLQLYTKLQSRPGRALTDPVRSHASQLSQNGADVEYSCTAPSADYGCTQIPVPQTPPIAQRFQRHSRWFSGSMDAVGPGGYFPLGRSLPSATSASQQRATPSSPLVHSSVTSAAALTASRALAIATPRPAGGKGV